MVDDKFPKDSNSHFYCWKWGTPTTDIGVVGSLKCEIGFAFCGRDVNGIKFYWKFNPRKEKKGKIMISIEPAKWT